MRAEAQPEQEARRRAEWEEVALVMEAVLEGVVVEGLRDDRANPARADVGAERPDVRTHGRVRRAELREHRVAERVALAEIGPWIANPVRVQEDGPAVQREPAPAGGLDRLLEDVALERGGRRARLEPGLPIARAVRAEAGRSGLEEAHLPTRVVGKDVTRLVVDGREGDASDAGAVLHVVQNGLDALVGEVRREREERGLHGFGAYCVLDAPSARVV